MPTTDPQELRRRLILQLASEAGNRGFTFAGRVAKPGESLDEIMARTPTGELESGSMAASAQDLVKAAIPIGWWKLMTPESKTMLTQVANKYPVLFEKVLDDPKKMIADVKELNPGYLGQMRPSVYPGLDKVLEVDKTQIQSGTPVHELVHFVQNQRVKDTKPIDAETIGLLIHEVLRQHRLPAGSLTNQLGAMGGATPGFAGFLAPFAKRPQFNINSLKSQRDRHGPQVLIDDRAYNSGPQIEANVRRRLIMDEGLAYLAEAATKPNAPTIIKLLAARLNILPE